MLLRHLTDALLFLKSSPLSGLLLTLLAYRIGLSVNRRVGGSPLLHPVVVAVAIVWGLLKLLDINHSEYMNGAQFIHALLGPATVALAVPLYFNLSRLKRAFLPLTLTLFLGCLIGVASSAGVGWLMGLPEPVVLSLVPRSVTTPFAVSIADQIGGVPELAAAFVVVSGIFGAVVVKPIFTRLGLMHDWVLGFATGIAAHGIGTARVFQVSERAGAFSGLAMGLNGVLTAILIPWLLTLFR